MKKKNLIVFFAFALVLWYGALSIFIIKSPASNTEVIARSGAVLSSEANLLGGSRDICLDVVSDHARPK